LQRSRRSPARTRALVLWGVQLALNASWSAIFFAARRPRAALGEIAALLASIAAYTNEARKIDRPAALLFAPYAAWTGFASVLNAAIVGKNPELA
jgi:translocator protein